MRTSEAYGKCVIELLIDWLIGWVSEWVTDRPIDLLSDWVHGANTASTWVLSAPDGPHVGPMNPVSEPASELVRHPSKLANTQPNASLIIMWIVPL